MDPDKRNALNIAQAASASEQKQIGHMPQSINVMNALVGGNKQCPQCGKKYTQGTLCDDDGTCLVDEPIDPFLGQTLKETYLIEKRIAQGGMGVIYRGTQISLGRAV